MHIILPTRTLFTCCCAMCHCNEYKLVIISAPNCETGAKNSTKC